MDQKKILVPTTSAESWKAFLADPDKHWKTGYSAKLTAESWEVAKNIPGEIHRALNKNEHLKNSEMLFAIPEFKVPLPGGSRPSQNDLLVVISNELSLSVITVEAKVKENFGDSIHTWIHDASKGKKERLQYIKQQLGISSNNIDDLRYQLFHRFASAVIMARKFHAQNAVMVIQSFAESDSENHYDDFRMFLSTCYGTESVKEKPIYLASVDSIKLFALWVYSKPQGNVKLTTILRG